MSSDSELKMISSQDLNHIWQDIEANLVPQNENMGIQEEEIPEQYSDIPGNSDFGGEYKFETYFDPLDTKNWLYSPLLNKIFIMSNSNFVVDFKWLPPNDKLNFFVRATPIYSSPQDMYKPVLRCVQHQQSTEPSNIGLTKMEIMHILRSVNPSAEYTGGIDRHFGVIVPLGKLQPGMDTVRCTYYFVCKNSCAAGINRRPIEVLFTLEDVSGNILGRKKVSVRVCSCPKRDKMKEEEEHGASCGRAVPKGRKRKAISNKKLSYSDSDTETYTVTLSVVGKRNMKSVLKTAQNVMAGEVLRRNNAEPYKNCYNKLGAMLKDLE